MKTRSVIQTIPVCYVVKVISENVQDIFGNSVFQDKYEGDVHLFELVTEHVEGSKPVSSRVATSFCGKAAWNIGGEMAKEYKYLPKGVPVCHECEAAWKADKRSPWLSWQKTVLGSGSE